MSTIALPSPLHQFEVKKLLDLTLFGWDVSFTNVSAFMLMVVGSVFLLFYLGIRKEQAIPTRTQALVEYLFEFISQMLRDTAGKEGRPYFPFVFSLFLFILGANLLGMIPYTYTITSQIIVTFALAMMVFVVITVVGIFRHGRAFISYFVPQGVPKVLWPLIVPIEMISYLSRPISLSVRLFANMMAGHTMLKVFAGFTVIMGIWGVAPLAVNVALTLFEFLIAVLQAYVFTILTCLYLHDALHLH